MKKSVCVTALWEIKILRPIAPNSELCNIRECIVRALNPRSHNSACSNVTVIAVMQTFPPSTDAWVRQPSFPVNDLQANNSHEKQKRNTCILLEKLLIRFGYLDRIGFLSENSWILFFLGFKGLFLEIGSYFQFTRGFDALYWPYDVGALVYSKPYWHINGPAFMSLTYSNSQLQPPFYFRAYVYVHTYYAL